MRAKIMMNASKLKRAPLLKLPCPGLRPMTNIAITRSENAARAKPPMAPATPMPAATRQSIRVILSVEYPMSRHACRPNFLRPLM